MRKRNVGSRVPTNAVYSSNAHGEAFKVIQPKNAHLRWETRTHAPKPRSGRLVRRQMTDADYERMGLG